MTDNQSPMARMDRADRALIDAVMEWSIDPDRTRAERELREAVFVHRQVMDAVRDNVRALVR